MKRKHSRLHTREARLRHRNAVIQYMKWSGQFIPPLPYRCINGGVWWWDSVLKMTHRRDRKPCSCWMCGNPRRYDNEKPYQELKVDLADEAEYDD